MGTIYGELVRSPLRCSRMLEGARAPRGPSRRAASCPGTAAPSAALGQRRASSVALQARDQRQPPSLLRDSAFFTPARNSVDPFRGGWDSRVGGQCTGSVEGDSGEPRFPLPGGEAGCAWVARAATICHDLHACPFYRSAIATSPNNRSKFNVALGIEAQGFCLISYLAHIPPPPCLLCPLCLDGEAVQTAFLARARRGTALDVAVNKLPDRPKSYLHRFTMLCNARNRC